MEKLLKNNYLKGLASNQNQEEIREKSTPEERSGTMVYSYSEILLTNKEEQITDTC